MQEFLKDKKHIIWDWNGTLLNDLDLTLETINYVLKLHSIDEIDKEFYLKNFRFPVKEYYRTLGFNVDNEELFSKFCHDFVDYYMERLGECHIHEFMSPILMDIKDDPSKKQSVLSAADQASLSRMVDRFQLGEYFSYVYGIADRQGGSKIKRGQELLRCLLEDESVDKGDMVMIGDTIHDWEVACDLGIDSVLVSHGHNSSDRLLEVNKNLFCYELGGT